MRLDPAIVQHQIANLFVQYPELAQDEQLRADMIEGATDTHEFLRLVERQRQLAAAMAGAIATNITDLETRQTRFERRELAMRQLMFRLLSAADLKKCELPEATLTLRNGTPKVIVTNETLLPESCFRIKREPDKVVIKERLANGPLPGAELSNAEPTLSIRTK